VANQRSPTPIIALTAAALKGDRELCMAAGCTAFLTKPIKQDVLLQAIRERFRAPAVGERRRSAKGSDSRARRPCDRRPDSGFPAESHAGCLSPCSTRSTGSDFQAVKTLGHGMKGAGGSYGFPAITDIGAALEDAADQFRHRGLAQMRRRIVALPGARGGRFR
jgi:hypothetical protein